MKPRLPERLWLDAAAEPPAGWIRYPADEAVRRLRARRVKAVALGMPAAAALQVAQAIEQGAFTGTLPRCAVELRLAEGDERAAVQEALAAAERHWQSVPTRAPEVAAKPGPLPMILRGIGLHLIGFIVVIGAFEVWSLLVRHEHAAGVGWVVRQVQELVHRGK